MRLIFLTFLFFFHNKILIAQLGENGCLSTVNEIRSLANKNCEMINHHDQIYSNEYLIDHVINTKISFPNECEFISNRRELINFTRKYSDNNTCDLFLNSNEIRCSFHLKIKNVNLTEHKLGFTSDIFGKPNNYDTVKYISSIDSIREFYGVSDDTIATMIDSFMIVKGTKTFYLPDSVKLKLFNPRIINEYFSMKPVNVYLSDRRNLIFIYLFSNNEQCPYMAKIIFDDFGFRRCIVLNASEIYAYQCLCDNFIGF